MKRKTNNKGFTITELVIVIAVIAILAAVLIPTFSNVVKKANESAYLQETTSAMKNYLANMAEDGETYSDGLLFIYDKDRVDDPTAAGELPSFDVSGKGDNRYYYAYINNSLHKVEVLGKLKDAKFGFDTSTYFQAENTQNGPYFNTDDFLVYKVEINSTVWYGVASITGVKGYGSTTKIETDAVRVCTGLAVPVESVAGDTNPDKTGVAKVVQDVPALPEGATYQKLVKQDGVTGSWEMVAKKANP